MEGVHNSHQYEGSITFLNICFSLNLDNAMQNLVHGVGPVWAAVQIWACMAERIKSR